MTEPYDWTSSEFWATLNFNEKRVEIAKYLQRVKELGLPVIITEKNGPEIEWSHPEKMLETDARGQCHLCRRSFTEEPSMRYWVRIVDPKYPEGFLDLGGVAHQCPHITRRETSKPWRGKEKERVFD